MKDVLLIDDNQERANAMASLLEENGLSVEHHTAFTDANGATCALILDRLAEGQIPHYSEQLPIVILTEAGSIPAAVAAIQQGAANYLSLPQDSAQLIAAIERAQQTAPKHQTSGLENFPMIGESVAMQTLKEGISRAAPTPSTVLVLGQSGTGKELVARAIHSASDRASAPLISINCATVPANLIEAELFGTEGLEQAKPGLIDAANGGTLFLDEISELPAAAQARLLRVIQGENRRVGSSNTQAVDVRLITATHQKLDKLVQAGQFREDLYYRLNVVCFDIPPLKERQEDILPIARWLLQRSCTRLGKSGIHFPPALERVMLAYHWPGNVRELENAVERAVILSDDDAEITQKLLAIEVSSSQDDAAETPAKSELTSLEDYFVKFVQEHQDNLTETELAEKLGISRKSLWERRQRLSIPRRKTRKRGRRVDQNSAEPANPKQDDTPNDAASRKLN